jgi:hypothetical protein
MPQPHWAFPTRAPEFAKRLAFWQSAALLARSTEERMDVEADARAVRRRRVFYLPGYDPRRPKVYHELFARELDAASRLRGYEADAGALDESDPLAPDFAVTAQHGEHHVAAQVAILRWDDLARPVYKSPLIPRLPKLLGVGYDLLRRGIVTRIARLDWQFAAFLAYPYLATLTAILLVLALGLLAGLVVTQAAPLASLPVAMAAAALAGWGMLRIERKFYLRYLLEDWLLSFAHESGATDVVADRLESFAERIAEAATDSATDEVLVVGHSSGAFLAPEALALALDRLPDLAQGRARISLLTIGAMASLMLCHSENSRYGRALARLSSEPGIAWYEVQSRHDVMNMCPVDPVAVAGLDHTARWPRIIGLSMPQLVASGRLGLFRERLFFFRNHFRFVFANERVEWYDFYGFLAGPLTLHARLRDFRPKFRC